MKASDLLVKALEHEGVKYIFGLPGEENLDFLDSLRKSKIKFIITRHEQSAGFMAATYGRLTGKPGVALSTLGPGATNLVTSAAFAQLGGFPTVFITGQKPIKKNDQGRFQMVDVVKIFRPVTKFSCQIKTASSIPTMVRVAFTKALEPKMGAVHLELPEDVAGEKTAAKLIPMKIEKLPIVSQRSIEKAVRIIKKSRSPLILLGAGANQNGLSDLLRRFVKKTGIPFVTTNLGKGAVSESEPLYLGTTAFSAGDYIHCATARADLIIAIGHDVVAKPPMIVRSRSQKLIHINFFSSSCLAVYQPQLSLVGDIKNTINQITDHIQSQPHWDFRYFMAVKKLVKEKMSERGQSNKFLILPQRLVQEIRQALPEDGILALDNGMYKLWFARSYQTTKPNTFLADDALATMGAGLPSAMTAALLFPNKKVVAVVGDGGFMMSSFELETAAALGLNLVVVIVNDAGFGMIKWKQKDLGMADFGLSYGNPDFREYAQSFGVKGYRVNSASQLSKLLKNSLSKRGITIIDVPIDYSQNFQVFSQELKKKLCP